MPVVDIASQLKGRGIAVHCDAAMGPAMLDVRVGSLGVDLLSLSAHKFNGPKGIGALYVRRGVRLAPLLFGGVQEGRARPGTENVVGAVGLARALELAAERRHDRSDSARGLADRLREGLSGIEGVSRVGPERERLPNTVLAEFEGCEGEALIVNLDLLGFSASTGSACAVGGTDPSPVLLAMGFSRKRAASTIRFSFGAGNTLDEVDRLVAALPAVVERLRAMAR
jgi:cysteine desulfurase